MKLLFYDVSDFEHNYLMDKMPTRVEPTYYKYSLNENTFIKNENKDIDAISVFVSSILNEKVLSQFKNLKFIFLRCVGFSNVDLEYCKKNKIYVLNTPNYGSKTVAEYVFALILSLSRKILKQEKMMSNFEIDVDEISGVELNNKVLGVIGTGNIGKCVIKIAHGFNMKVLCFDEKKEDNLKYVSFDELISKSDFISINCPLNTSSKKMIDKNALSKMKKSAYLINTARGEIIDTEALYRALLDKKIKGAALDVIECEEKLCEIYKKCRKNDFLNDYCLKKYFFIEKLIKLDNVIITPHNAYNTLEAKTRILDITVKNIISSFDINNGIDNLVLL